MASYSKCDKEMKECPICLIDFEPTDDSIIVFDCDAKHYFHEKCGKEWLQVKTECPLCRFDFSKKINELIKNKGKDLVQEASRVAVEFQNNQLALVRNASDNSEIQLGELALQLADSVGDLERR